MSDEQSIRDELVELLNSPQHAPMSTHSGYDGSCQDCPWPLSHLPVEEIAAEILSSPVIRRIQAEAHDQGYRQGIRDASGVEYTELVASQYRGETA